MLKVSVSTQDIDTYYGISTIKLEGLKVLIKVAKLNSNYIEGTLKMQ